MLPIFLILLISYTTYWVNTKDLESRVTISIVCLLSLIAYNFIIDEDLPKLGYLTFMDNFILLSYVFAGLPTIQSVFSKYFLENNKNETSKYLDSYAKIYLPPSYLMSLVYLIYTYDIF
jgi:hypothetical protein